MASARPVTTNRGVQLSVGVLHVLLGVALALFMNHYVRYFSLLAREWYDSYWLPLWVACLTYAFESGSRRPFSFSKCLTSCGSAHPDVHFRTLFPEFGQFWLGLVL